MTRWLEAVAARAGVGVDEAAVRDVLDRFHVRANRQPGKPHHVVVKRVAFTGERLLESDDTLEPCSFEWNLGPGIWCVASDDNLVGKTTVLEMIRFGIRGSADFQSDVSSWLRTAEIHGSIDDETFEVNARFDQGRPSGELLVNGNVAGNFATEEAAEEIIGEFMTSRLGLDPIPYWSNDAGAGSERMMSWPVYSSALYIKSLSYLIGEPDSATWGGAAGKMLELFIGAPWASTLAASRVAIRHEDQRIQATKRRKKLDESTASGAIKELEDELANAKERLASMPDPAAALAAADDALQTLRTHDARLVELQARASELEEQRRTARQVELEDTRRLRDLTENERAAAFFATLDPTMCPRCETAVTSDRRAREGEIHECAVCGSHLDARAQDPTIVAELERSIAEAQKHQEDAAAERVLIGNEISDVVTRRVVLRGRAERLGQQTENQQVRRALELEIARLAGALGERRHRADPEEMDGDLEQAERDRAILKAAEVEAEERVKVAEGDLFAAVNEEIVRLAHAFGMDALETVKLDRAARLRVRKGGTDTSYSSLTDGEKLRLKIAVCLAMLRVGEKRGIGRYPGLLLLDSPGQQETAGEDVVSILQELQRVAGDLPKLQIIAASAQASLVRAALPAAQIRVAEHGKKLW